MSEMLPLPRYVPKCPFWQSARAVFQPPLWNDCAEALTAGLDALDTPLAGPV